ncbi:MAG: tRNA pseudouridine(38-40) synthase TruA [Campylobacterota bacterium]|nr:tRNA pseudouridine(38-40) synthase TruA [Campylobacterota bacterium]
MSRVKAVIAYDGSAYHGFQKQTSTTQTITYQIESALNALHIQSSIVASGRTDAGVHATGQVIHFDIPEYWNDLKKLTLNLNRQLHDIQCKHITLVANDFHARFSAKRRLYRYVFKTSKPTVFEKKYISYYESFNLLALQDALSLFIGKHDFDYFRKTGTQTHTSIREVYKAFYVQRGQYHFIYFEANGFLRSQVRMMVESAMLVAKNKLSKEQLLAQLACQTKFTTKLAPPEGLYLAKIIY